MVKSVNWRDISYLREGTSRHREAYRTLTQLNLLDALRPYDPVLTSTINIDIDIPGRDLDIICEVTDKTSFLEVVKANFAKFPHFAIRQSIRLEFVPTIVQFKSPLFEIEIFAAPQPVEEQNAYRHLETFNRVIELGGEDFKKKVRVLKQSGIKTEPAFAKLLGLRGDPYQVVCELNDIPDKELVRMCKDAV